MDDLNLRTAEWYATLIKTELRTSELPIKSSEDIETFIEENLFYAWLRDAKAIRLGTPQLLEVTENGEKYEALDIPVLVHNLITHTDEELLFRYYKDVSNIQPGICLQIFDESDNMLYWRSQEQDPTKEWLINSWANDITNPDGTFVFEGEPTNI